MTLYDQVFKGQYPEPYESFCDREHLPFEAKATWAHYCATERSDLTAEARDALWGRYASRGFSSVSVDGVCTPLLERADIGELDGSLKSVRGAMSAQN